MDEDQLPEAREDDAQIERRMNSIKDAWAEQVKPWKANINPSIALALMIMPNTLSMVALMNEKAPAYEQVGYERVFFGILVGMLMSFIFNGGSILLKGLTPVQTLILIAQIKAYGLESLPFTCIGSGLVMLMFIYMKLHATLKVMPYTILVGFKQSLGSSC